MALDEQALFHKKPETRTGRYQCPKCRRTGDYSIRWVRHSKKTRLPAVTNREDQAKFEKLRDYLLRVDDHVTCKTCGKKFEIPSQHSLMFVEQFAGLPDEEDLERHPGLDVLGREHLRPTGHYGENSRNGQESPFQTSIGHAHSPV